MNTKTLLLTIGLVLITFGIVKPDISNFLPQKNSVVENSNVVKEKPLNPELLTQAQNVASIIKKGGSGRGVDAIKLSSLYYDLATLIEIDGDDQVVKNTLEIREANKLAGLFSKLGLGGKYEGLAEACNSLVVAGIGDSDVVLDENIRKKAVETFKALSWACYEGSK
jgi:hypothetical protein